MLSLMGELTDTFAWHEKVFDQAFINQWKGGKLAQEGVTHKMVDWVRQRCKTLQIRVGLTDVQCLREVQQRAREYGVSPLIPALGRGIFKMDDFVRPTQREKMCQAISRLERDLRDSGCLLARSDGITKLVDPSLFPFSFERSRCLKEGKVGRGDSIQQCGRGQIVGQPGGSERALKGRGCYANDVAWSLRYQLLPFDIHFSGNTSSAMYACSMCGLV